MNNQKDELRRRMRAEAKRHSDQERAAGSKEICQRIQAQAIWQRAQSVLLFVPTASEPDISELLKAGKDVSLPAFNEKRAQYEARAISGPQDLVPGQFGILEPKPECPLLELNTLNLILAPGLAFALDGTRLGRGKGFYDRLLARITAPKCGVCFDWQVRPAIPWDAHDVLMDYIVTSSRWHKV